MTGENPDTNPVRNHENPIDPATIEESLSDSIKEKYGDQRLTGEERRDALSEHEHHLVRDTHSQITFHPESLGRIQPEVTATVPDTYCFTCEEWIGLSGLDLPGTPRSRAEAYYLDGPPGEVIDLQKRVHDSVTDLAGTIIDEHPDINTPAEAATFITSEIEQIKNDLVAERPEDTNSSE